MVRDRYCPARRYRVMSPWGPPTHEPTLRSIGGKEPAAADGDHLLRVIHSCDVDEYTANCAGLTLPQGMSGCMLASSRWVCTCMCVQGKACVADKRAGIVSTTSLVPRARQIGCANKADMHSGQSPRCYSAPHWCFESMPGLCVCGCIGQIMVVVDDPSGRSTLRLSVPALIQKRNNDASRNVPGQLDSRFEPQGLG